MVADPPERDPNRADSRTRLPVVSIEALEMFDDEPTSFATVIAPFCALDLGTDFGCTRVVVEDNGAVR